MTPDRWQHLKALVSQVFQLPGAERPAFLDNAYAQDPDLRQQLAPFLYPDSGIEDFLEADSPEIVPTDDAHLDTRIGRYRVLRELGRGGMGQVILAERADGHFNQQVALKLVKRGMDSDEILRRFQHERQILAALQHPNIARLYDGGRTEDGRPYFVMEYVQGESITSYADRKRLTTAQRLALFRVVCAAVQYAHRNLIVHRDLKPSNILVTEEGTVKLLDFGIAKLLSDEQTPETVLQTQAGLRLMTPEYAAPEQIRGDIVTTATDVYQLGVVLYELLTGHRPYHLESRVRAEVERIILEEEPTRPSTAIGTTQDAETVSLARRTSRERLRRRLAGDLDTIVLMALRKDINQRYGSAEHLSEDLRRHLVGLPVQAQSATLRYRVSKFIRRHRIGVGATAVIVSLMLTVVTLVILFAVTQAQQNERITQERDKAQHVVNYLIDIFKVSNPDETQGQQITAEEILRRGATQAAHDLAAQPDVLALMQHTIGTVYTNLGLYTAADSLLRQALALRTQPQREDLSPDQATTLHQLGVLTVLRGNYHAARPLLDEALHIRETLYGPTHADVAHTLRERAYIDYVEGNYEAADSRYSQILSVLEALPDTLDNLLAGVTNDLAMIRTQEERYTEAELLFRQALAAHRRLHGNLNMDVATDLSNLALVLKRQNRLDEAEPIYREVLSISRTLLDPNHPDLATDLNNFGTFQQDRGNLTEAESLFREALQIRRSALPEGHPHITYSLLGLGQSLMRQDQAGDALPFLQEGVEIWEAALPESHWATAYARSVLGACLTQLQRYTEAEPLLRNSFAQLREIRGLEDGYTQRSATSLAELYDAWNKPDAAATYRALLDNADSR